MQSHACQHTLEIEIPDDLRLDKRVPIRLSEAAIGVIADERLPSLCKNSDPRRTVLTARDQ